MRRHRGIRVDSKDHGASVAIGNFDGVHRGHLAVLEAARAKGPLGVVTFEPHPRGLFAPDAPPFRLMDAEARAHQLERLGVTQLYEIPFDAALAAMPAQRFIDEVLVAGLGVSHVTVGPDFRFGRGRDGDAGLLLAQGAFGGQIAPLLESDGARVSSTAIRTALSDGRPEVAREMLGHWHRIEGPVRHGEKRGRALGFPTANMHLDDLHLPRFGVYAVIVDVLTGRHKGSYHGAASLGVRPTFAGAAVPNLESFLFDFEGDLYGETLSVGLVAFLRPEIAFDGANWRAELIAQMDADCAEARRLLAERL